MVVDAHVHVWPTSAPVADPEIARAGTVEAVRSALDAAGVERAVVVQPSACGADHTHLLDAVGSSGGRWTAVVLAEPDEPDAVADLTRLLAEPGIRGVRLPLVRASQEWFDAVAADVWSTAAAHDAIVCPLLNPTQLAWIEPWIERHPAVPVVVDHLARIGATDDDRGATLDALCALAAHRNVHVKVSALSTLSAQAAPHPDLAPTIAAVLAAFGPRRAMWGSDYPMVLHDGPYAQALRSAETLLEPHGPDAARAVLGETASRLFWREAA